MQINKYSTKTLSSTLALLSASLLVACGGGDDGYGYYDDSVSECSQIGQNRFVYDVMQQWYFWDASISSSIDPDSYSSVDTLLDAMVANAPELDRFSYIAEQESSEKFFEQGLFTGLGFTSKQINEQLFLAYVFPGSPAANAGLARGFEIVSVDGVNVQTTLAAGDFVDFGASEAGTQVVIDYKDLQGNEFTSSITKAETPVPTTPVSKVIDNNGVNTGYMFFYTFIEPSNQSLANTFAQFSNDGVQDLIVDLRYNTGGLISVANYLSGLIGGTTTQNEVLSKRLHNSQRASENTTTFFSNEIDALDLERVIFITTDSTASASELVINSLSPYLDVMIVGETTFGKPVGQYGFDFCGNTLFPVSFETVNALDQGRYFTGLEPDCVASDDITRVIGDEQEASLSTALSFLATGSCPVAQQKSSFKTYSQSSSELMENTKATRSYRVINAD